MNSFMKHLIFVAFLIIFVSFSSSGFSSETCNRILAIVNDDIITLYELDKKILELTGKKPVELENQNKQEFMVIRKQILDLLIDEKIVQAKTKELGFEASERELDVSIENIKKGNKWTQEDMIAAISAQGLNYEQFRKKIKQEMEQSRLIGYEVKSKIVVSDEAIKEYFDENIHEYSTEAKVRLGVIFIPASNTNGSLNKIADKINKLLQAGKTFSELAQEYSKGPNADTGGDLGMIEPSQLDPKLRGMIQGMSEGDVSDPIISSAGIQFIKLIEKHEKGVKSIEDVKDTIYGILYDEEIKERYSSWIKELREDAYIKIIF